MKKIKLFLEVEIDIGPEEEDHVVSMDDGIIYASHCGDRYNSIHDFLFHQFARDLQVVRPISLVIQEGL